VNTKELVTMGTDVEFLMQGPDGSFVPAGLVLPNNGMIGTDGAGGHAGMRYIAEVRALPRSDVREVVNDVGRCLRAIDTHLRKNGIEDEIIYLAGHYHHGKAIGGHVHQSSPFFVDPVAVTAMRLQHYWCSLMTRTFDDPEAVKLRTAAGYYKNDPFEAVRAQPELYGIRYYHYEYRNWGSYLISPLYAYAVIALAKMSALTAITWPEREPDKDAFKKWNLEDILNLVKTHVLTDDIMALPDVLTKLDELRPAIQKSWKENFIQRWL